MPSIVCDRTHIQQIIRHEPFVVGYYCKFKLSVILNFTSQEFFKEIKVFWVVADGYCMKLANFGAQAFMQISCGKPTVPDVEFVESTSIKVPKLRSEII